MLIKVQHGQIVWTNIQYILMDFFNMITILITMSEKLENLKQTNKACLSYHANIVQLVVNFLEENFDSWDDFENSNFENEIPENTSLIKDVLQTALEQSWGGLDSK